ncbi:MAG TPA: peptidase M48 Ste24p, partial [Thauera sp.]|nr:peptidase M48 Ste24p [Thauera sp.]
MAATLRCERGQVRVVAEGGDLLAAAERDEVEVSSRLGNTPRFIRFKGGEAFETADNDGVDRLLPAAGAGLLHHLESRLRYVLLGVLVTVAFVWASVQWGVPMAARAIAASLPQSVHAHADSLVLELIDRQMMAPS